VPFYREFLRRFPSVKKLAAAPLQEVLKAWEGLGYYSRARNLWRAARQVVENLHGRIPLEYDRFRELPGVGEYIAAAVLSIGRAFPCRSWTAMCCALSAAGRGSAATCAGRQRGARSAPSWRRSSPGMTRAGSTRLDGIGALVCLSGEPRCPDCPLRPGCFACRRGRTGSLPVRSRKGPVPEYRVALAVIRRGRRVFIQQRPEQGHLGGLWEFPGGKCRLGEAPRQAVVRECREELGIDVQVEAELAVVRHAYSHFKVILHVFVCRPGPGRIRSPRPHGWVMMAELGRYPFPAANHRIFSLLEEYLKTQGKNCSSH